MPEVRTTAGQPARAQHRVAEPAAVPVDRRGSRRARVLLGPGPDDAQRSTPTGTGTWQTFGQRDAINRDYGSHALYDIGKILVAGGGPSSRDARVIDINGATPQVTPTAPMANGRRQHNLTVLADGSVLATGGNSSGAGLVDLNNGVYAAERWNPATGTWRTLAAEAGDAPVPLDRAAAARRARAVLGRRHLRHLRPVGYLAKNAQVFTPALPVQERRLRRARPAAGDRRGARRRDLRGAVRDRHAARPPRSPRWRWSASAR